MRLVTLVPSRPAIGESFTAKRIESVGGSIGCACSGVVTVGSAIVFETVAMVRPAIETMSPADASSTGTRSSPRNAITFDARPLSTTVPSASSAWIGMLTRSRPLLIRPVRMRPTKLSRSSNVTRKVNSSSAFTLGAGTCSTILLNNGASVPSRASGSSLA